MKFLKWTIGIVTCIFSFFSIGICVGVNKDNAFTAGLLITLFVALFGLYLSQIVMRLLKNEAKRKKVCKRLKKTAIIFFVIAAILSVAGLVFAEDNSGYQLTAHDGGADTIGMSTGDVYFSYDYSHEVDYSGLIQLLLVAPFIVSIILGVIYFVCENVPAYEDMTDEEKAKTKKTLIWTSIPVVGIIALVVFLVIMIP